jgi:hypothetical protein
VQAFVSYILAGLLLIQSVTGWCWQCSSEPNSPTADAATVQHDCSCYECDGATGEAPSPEPGECPWECQGICIYFSSLSTHLDALQFDLALDLVTVLSDFRYLSPVAPWEQAGDALAARPPLRLHLLHQILLI